MQGERFCNNCYKIAPCFGEKYNSDDHRLAADIDLPIGDGQITAQLIFVHAVGQRHRYAAAAAGQTAENRVADTNNRNMKNLFMSLSLKIKRCYILYRPFR